MSYFKKIEYEIVPVKSFPVIRNCAGCGTKTRYQNTKKFRVNANGNRLDIWLIYQCEKCKHTFNLTVYERQKPSSIPKEDYRRFLCNDEELAEAYGRSFPFFKKNKAEVDFDGLMYRFAKLQETERENTDANRVLIVIHNPCEIKIRPEKQIAEVLGLSRSHVKKLMKQEAIIIENTSPQFLSIICQTLYHQPSFV